MLVNSQIVEYVERKILPLYDANDKGHGLDHVNYVIKRSFDLIKGMKDINEDMVYVIAAYHDVGVSIDRDNHENVSAEMFYNDQKMKEFFTDEERLVIKEAIEDHRALLEYEPRSIYGKIVSSADKNIEVDVALRRTHGHSIKYFPDLSLDEMIERAYGHIEEKFGNNGYAKNYLEDDAYRKYKEGIKKLLSDKEYFRKKYMEVNGINDDVRKKKLSSDS